MFEGVLMNKTEQLAEFFKILGEPTRLNILNSLIEEERSVSQIADTLSMTSSAISHQLKLLKLHRLVKSRKDGKEVYYSLDDHHVFDILNLGSTHLSEAHHD